MNEIIKKINKFMDGSNVLSQCRRLVQSGASWQIKAAATSTATQIRHPVAGHRRTRRSGSWMAAMCCQQCRRLVQSGTELADQGQRRLQRRRKSDILWQGTDGRGDLAHGWHNVLSNSAAARSIGRAGRSRQRRLQRRRKSTSVAHDDARSAHITMFVESASLIGHSGSSAFRLSTTTVSMSLTGSCFSSESAPGALPSWDSRTRWNNLSGGLAVRRTAGPSGHANSPHPSSREGHHSTARWSSSVLLLD